MGNKKTGNMTKVERQYLHNHAHDMTKAQLAEKMSRTIQFVEWNMRRLGIIDGKFVQDYICGRL